MGDPVSDALCVGVAEALWLHESVTATPFDSLGTNMERASAGASTVQRQYRVNVFGQFRAGSLMGGKKAVHAPQQHAAIVQLVELALQIDAAFEL